MEKYKFTVKPGRPRNLVLLIVAMIVLGAGTAWAVTTVTSTIKFVTDLSVATVASPNLGYVKAGVTGTYALDTTGAVTAGGTGVKEGGVPAAGHYTITGSASQAININDGNYVVSGASTPSLARCRYGAGAETSCTNLNVAAPGGGTALFVGLTVTTSAAGADNQTDSPKFDLTIVYQ
jgi:hypothetical protein